MATQTTKPDHWSAQKYSAAANFVPQLATKVLTHLTPQPSEHILDIGCGDGQLTTAIASAVSSTGKVLGLDASPSFISTATQNETNPHCTYTLQDCTALGENEALKSTQGQWDKAFSNAAMHWILRAPSTRATFFRDVHAALKPGGTFAFEMGGKGNVAELHSAFTAALTTHGNLSLSAAREASPWFFPSDFWMRRALEEAGFDVEVCELEYRPTKLTEEKADGSGGLEGWVRLMGARFLEAVEEEGKREEVVRAVCGWVEGCLRREEDGSVWVGYVRLRALGRKR